MHLCYRSPGRRVGHAVNVEHLDVPAQVHILLNLCVSDGLSMLRGLIQSVDRRPWVLSRGGGVERRDGVALVVHRAVERYRLHVLDRTAVPRLVILLNHLAQLVMVVDFCKITQRWLGEGKICGTLTIELFPRLLELVGALEARPDYARRLGLPHLRMAFTTAEKRTNS